MPESRTWNGTSYDRISGPMAAMGEAVLERLQLDGDELVLDAGCGSGRVTEALIQRLPRGRVIAVDASPSMAQAARERLGTTADVRVLDLLELELEAPVDAILSTATFHWIADHDKLFARLHDVLVPGGSLVAQCGGEGNISELRGRAATLLAREPFAEHFRDWRSPWNYASAEDTAARLQRAGFSAVRCWLQPKPTQPDHAREFLATIVFGPHVQQLPEELRERFVDALLAEVGEPVIVDYVRLNIQATA